MVFYCPYRLRLLLWLNCYGFWLHNDVSTGGIGAGTVVLDAQHSVGMVMKEVKSIFFKGHICINSISSSGAPSSIPLQHTQEKYQGNTMVVCVFQSVKPAPSNLNRQTYLH